MQVPHRSGFPSVATAVQFFSYPVPVRVFLHAHMYTWGVLYKRLQHYSVICRQLASASLPCWAAGAADSRQMKLTYKSRGQQLFLRDEEG